MRLFNEVEFDARPQQSFSSHILKRICLEYEKYIAELEEEIAALQSDRPHNERGAGRKPKAMPEQREYILSLAAQGISHYQIARMMTAQTGGKWNKTTIRNMVIASGNAPQP